MVPNNCLIRSFQLHQKEYEEKALDVLRSGWYVLGKEVSSFEKAMADYVGTKHCIGVDNGLNAIVLGIKALDIGMGDEVIVAANTYIATVLGVSLNKAKAVFVDADQFQNIDPEKIEDSITNKTKAVLVTHLYGQSCQMDKIKQICDKYNLYLLEDCAQAHGAECCNRQVGSWGIMGFFSFYPTKNLGGFGDGGAITTNDNMLEEKLRALRNYGSVERYVNDYEGHNSRLDELQAGLLNVKLKYMDDITGERRTIAERYLSEIKNPGIDLPKIAAHCTHVYHLFVVQIEERKRFRDFLEKRGISTDIHYPTPPYLAQPYRNLGYTEDSFPMTRKLYSKIVSIPIFNGMTKEEQTEIINAINEFK